MYVLQQAKIKIKPCVLQYGKSQVWECSHGEFIFDSFKAALLRHSLLQFKKDVLTDPDTESCTVSVIECSREHNELVLVVKVENVEHKFYVYSLNADLDILVEVQSKFTSIEMMLPDGNCTVFSDLHEALQSVGKIRYLRCSYNIYFQGASGDFIRVCSQRVTLRGWLNFVAEFLNDRVYLKVPGCTVSAYKVYSICNEEDTTSFLLGIECDLHNKHICTQVYRIELSGTKGDN